MRAGRSIYGVCERCTMQLDSGTGVRMIIDERETVTHTDTHTRDTRAHCRDPRWWPRRSGRRVAQSPQTEMARKSIHEAKRRRPADGSTKVKF